MLHLILALTFLRQPSRTGPARVPPRKLEFFSEWVFVAVHTDALLDKYLTTVNS